MGENKQVRVDNWGTFLLQRLQAFFNKTDYCDLTLQFDGNVQLKVHRLVMNACTDYFHILEQTCEMIDDVLMMPPDLTPDIILPIVNFMYTGVLEFQVSTYQKLYKAAELMEMPILTKILDAQKAKIAQKNPRVRNIQQSRNTSHQRKSSPDLPATLPGRKLPVWKRKSVPSNTTQQFTPATSQFSEIKQTNSDPLFLYDNTPKPTRFEWPEEELTNFPLLETSSFDDISYTTKQILTQDEEMRSSSSTFDEVKHLPNLNKRSTTYNASQIDIEEVKNYVKEQKARSELADFTTEEDVDNDLSEIDSLKRKPEKQIVTRQTKRVKYNLSEKENITTVTTSSAPTAKTASGSPSSDVNYQIISEVLKKYPHLVKKNKNIRLKILAKSPSKTEQPPASVPDVKTNVVKPETTKKKTDDEGPWTCQKCSTPTESVEFVLYYLYRKHMTDVHYEKFDSTQCKFCGYKSTGLTMLMYHQYVKHDIKPPTNYNFPKCKQCPYIAASDALLVKHNTNHSKLDVRCNECRITFNNKTSLTSHMQITGHISKTEKSNFDCQYCTKRLPTDLHLFMHIKTNHRDEGRRDGIVSIDEEEVEVLNEDEVEIIKPAAPKKEVDGNKIKILSNVTVSSAKTTTSSKTNQQKVTPTVQKSQNNQIKLDADADVAASLGLVDIVVLDDNQQYILQSNTQDTSTEYILPDLSPNFTTQNNQPITQTMLAGNSDIASTDELVMVLTDHDYNDANNEMLNAENSNIVVLYSHPVEGSTDNHQFITSQGNIITTSQGNLITTQGNLVINSQTGLIELRNPNDGQVLSQDESIEMIQQEINSHKDYKVADNYQEAKIDTEVREKENNDQPMEETEFADKNDEADNKLLTEQIQKESIGKPKLTDDENVNNLTPSNDNERVCEESIVDSDKPPPEVGSTESPIDAETESPIDAACVNVEESTKTPVAEEPMDISTDTVEVVSEENIENKQQEEINTNIPQESKELNTEEVTVETVTTDEPPASEMVEDTLHSKDNETEHTDDAEAIKNDNDVDKQNEITTNQVQTDENEIGIVKEELKHTNIEVAENAAIELEKEHETEVVEQLDNNSTSIINVNNRSVEEEKENTDANEENKESDVATQNVENNKTENEELNQEDDNSKLSENTSDSAQKETSQSTKIAILHDWEDTDSQQSEHPGTPKNEVNKLINDWEDEDDIKN